MGWLRSKNIYVVFGIFLFLYVLITAYISISAGNHHLFNRFGGFLCAIGAMLIILQVLAEEKMQQGNERDHEAIEPLEISPENAEIAHRVVSARAASRRSQRMRIVVAIAAVIFVGELVHGWGDLVLDALIGGDRHDIAAGDIANRHDPALNSSE